MRIDLIEMAAGEFVESHGLGAPPILRQRAERAAELGHRVAAGTWLDMAHIAERIVRDTGLAADTPTRH